MIRRRRRRRKRRVESIEMISKPKLSFPTLDNFMDSDTSYAKNVLLDHKTCVLISFFRELAEILTAGIPELVTKLSKGCAEEKVINNDNNFHLIISK